MIYLKGLSFCFRLSLWVAVFQLLTGPCYAQADTPAWVAEKLESVVMISGYMEVGHGMREPSSPHARASGFIIDQKGIVLTTYARFLDKKKRLLCDRFEVRLHDGKTVGATAVAVDPVLNLAILRMAEPDGSGAGYPALSVDVKTTVQTGTRVLALGAGDDPVSVGTVKVKARKTLYGSGLGDMLINFRINMPKLAYGGPLFDGEGRLIAMNTANIHKALAAVLNDDEEHGLPMSIIMTFYKVLMTYPTFELPWTGFAYRNLTTEERTRLEDRDLPSRGLMIDYVWPDSIAVAAGLQEGDLLLEVNGQPFANQYSLDRFLYKTGSGKTITLKGLRSGTPLHTQLVTEKRPHWAAP